jgi:hypothetical protein
MTTNRRNNRNKNKNKQKKKKMKRKKYNFQIIRLLEQKVKTKFQRMIS